MRQPAPKTNRERVAANIRRRREALTLTQEDLAFALGSSTQTISRIERGENSPRLDTFLDLARALSTTPAELLRGVK